MAVKGGGGLCFISSAVMLHKEGVMLHKEGVMLHKQGVMLHKNQSRSLTKNLNSLFQGVPAISCFIRMA